MPAECLARALLCAVVLQRRSLPVEQLCLSVSHHAGGEREALYGSKAACYWMLYAETCRWMLHLVLLSVPTHLHDHRHLPVRQGVVARPLEVGVEETSPSVRAVCNSALSDRWCLRTRAASANGDTQHLAPEAS